MAPKINYLIAYKKRSRFKGFIKTTLLATLLAILMSGTYSFLIFDKAHAQDANAGLIATLAGWWKEIKDASKVYNDHIKEVNETMKTFDRTNEAIQNIRNIDLKIEQQREQIRKIFDVRLKNGESWTKFRLNKIDPEAFVTVQAIKGYYSDYKATYEDLEARISILTKEEKEKYNTRGKILNKGIEAHVEAAEAGILYSALKQEVSSIEKEINSLPVGADKKHEAMAMAMVPIQTKIALYQLKLDAYSIRQRQALLEQLGIGKSIGNAPKYKESDLQKIVDNAQLGELGWRPKAGKK